MCVQPAGNSKNAKGHTVFLSDFTKEQFQALNKITGDFDWCLHSRDGKHHTSLKSVAKQIKDRVRSESLANRTKATGALLLTGGGWTTHDLRRTGATKMGELGVMGDVASLAALILARPSPARHLPRSLQAA